MIIPDNKVNVTVSVAGVEETPPTNLEHIVQIETYSSFRKLVSICAAVARCAAVWKTKLSGQHKVVNIKEMNFIRRPRRNFAKY